MEIYKVLGVMSGTSLDGLDLAYCELIKDKTWSYKILHSTTITYSEKRINILKNAHLLNGEELTALNHKFGKYIGEECKKFIQEYKIQPDFISSHGHTVFHQPERGFTLQIGNGPEIQVINGIPTVSDFRSQDVALGGQGAPLVPIGDQFLFGEYGACVNLGGFANISTQNKNNRVAWDICAVNVVLNHLAKKTGATFDYGGTLARGGKLYQPLLDDLRKLDFYKEAPPKSLGIEWVQNQLIYLLEKYMISTEDILHTYVLHIAEVIGGVIDGTQTNKVLITGGGTYNHFLIESIRKQTKSEVFIPDDNTIQFKEALIFAFLGVLKWRGEVNVLSSVTGAKYDHSSGVIYGK